ncbi:MAG: cupredoxin domain-containing protein [Bacillota bacterium]
MKRKCCILSTVLLVIVGVSLLAGCTGNQQTSSGEAQALPIQVTSGGYSPEVLEVKKGSPVILNFEAGSRLGCAGELEIPEFGVRKTLEPGKTTPVEILPEKAGDIIIRCSMNMFATTLAVK